MFQPGSFIRLFFCCLLCVLAGGLAAAEKKESGGKAKVVEKEGVVLGVPLSRPNGTWLGLTVENGVWVVRFYNAKKKPVHSDMTRGRAKWNPPQKTGSMNVVLNPSADGFALVGSQFVQPPRVIKLYLTLSNAKGDVTESYVVDYHD